MDRSPGFGSTNTNSAPYSDLVSLRLRTFSVLNLASSSNSPDRSTKSTPSHLRALTVCKHRVSGSFSLPSRGSFHLSFTVLLHYRSLGSIQAWGVVPPASHRVSRVPWYSGYCQLTFDFVYWTFTVYGLLSQNNSTINRQYLIQSATPQNQVPRFGLFPFRSPLLWKSSFLSSPAATQMFQFTVCSLVKLCIHLTILEVFSSRFPHSDIYGSLVMCTSPQLFAAYHVLLRLLVPRHSPCALYCLTISSMLECSSDTTYS